MSQTKCLCMLNQENVFNIEKSVAYTYKNHWCTWSLVSSHMRFFQFYIVVFQSNNVCKTDLQILYNVFFFFCVQHPTTSHEEKNTPGDQVWARCWEELASFFDWLSDWKSQIWLGWVNSIIVFLAQCNLSHSQGWCRQAHGVSMMCVKQHHRCMCGYTTKNLQN